MSVWQARSQRPPSSVAEEIQEGGRNFWKQILTDNFIVTQNICKRVCFFAKKRRNSVKSNAALRLFSNVRWTRFDCRAVVIDRRCGRSMPRAIAEHDKKLDIDRPKAFHRWTGHPSTSSESVESVIIIGEILKRAKWFLEGRYPSTRPSGYMSALVRLWTTRSLATSMWARYPSGPSSVACWVSRDERWSRWMIWVDDQVRLTCHMWRRAASSIFLRFEIDRSSAIYKCFRIRF